MMDAQQIHAMLGADGWIHVLRASGLQDSQLRKKNGPCPACGGEDRYSFDNRSGRGDFFCRQCGPGDGFQLIMRTQGIAFRDARKLVLELAGVRDVQMDPIRAPDPEPKIARATRRVLQLIRESCLVEDCEPARLYLASRYLWPLPSGHSLRAHSSVEYWEEGKRLGRFPALIAAVRDRYGEIVTVHVTYLEHDGSKLREHEPRKILSALTGREGCAVHLMPHGSTLGIAEGIETALSASFMHEIPVWSALNTSLLQKFIPPQSVQKLVIFADRDIAGLDAATKLMQRLQGSVQMEIKTPQSKDWNDALRSAA